MHNALPLIFALSFATTQLQAQAPDVGNSFAGFPVSAGGRFVGHVSVAIFVWDTPLKASSCAELLKPLRSWRESLSGFSR